MIKSIQLLGKCQEPIKFVSLINRKQQRIFIYFYLFKHFLQKNNQQR